LCRNQTTRKTVCRRDGRCCWFRGSGRWSTTLQVRGLKIETLYSPSPLSAGEVRHRSTALFIPIRLERVYCLPQEILMADALLYKNICGVKLYLVIIIRFAVIFCFWFVLACGTGSSNKFTTRESVTVLGNKRGKCRTLSSLRQSTA